MLRSREVSLRSQQRTQAMFQSSVSGRLLNLSSQQSSTGCNENPLVLAEPSSILGTLRNLSNYLLIPANGIRKYLFRFFQTVLLTP